MENEIQAPENLQERMEQLQQSDSYKRLQRKQKKKQAQMYLRALVRTRKVMSGRKKGRKKRL